MKIETVRTQLISAIWQAVAQSGVNLSSIPQKEQDDLVRSIADRVMITIDSLLDEAVEAEMNDQSDSGKDADQDEKGKAAAEFDEKVLWQARPFLSLVEKYIVTNERIKIIHGMLSRNIENFELIRIQDIDFKQNVGERMLGIGDIFIKGHDPSDPDVRLRNIHKPEEAYEILRRAWMDARKRHGLQFREYM